VAISADAIDRRRRRRRGCVILLAIAIRAAWAGQSALAAPPTPAQPAPAAEAPPVAPASTTIAGGGTTLRSVHINLPRSDSTFPGGAEADAINNNCLICHSAGMVLDQASLSRAAWQGEVEKMRNDFKAPFAAGDVPAMVDYLVNLKSVLAQSAGRQPDARHGAVIVAQGTTAGAPPCAQCHAFNGVSDASGAFPRLAGQSAHYLAGQLRDFASGVRASALMSPIARALSPDDVADVARASTRRFCRSKRPMPRSSSAARSSPRQGDPRDCIATIATDRAARASLRSSHTLPDNTPTTSPSPCRCGSWVSARTVPTRWRSSPRSSTTKKSRQLPPTTSR